MLVDLNDDPIIKGMVARKEQQGKACWGRKDIKNIKFSIKYETEVSYKICGH